MNLHWTFTDRDELDVERDEFSYWKFREVEVGSVSV